MRYHWYAMVHEFGVRLGDARRLDPSFKVRTAETFVRSEATSCLLYILDVDVQRRLASLVPNTILTSLRSS